MADSTPISTQYASAGVTFSAVNGTDSSVLPVATNYAAGPSGPLYSGNYLANAPSGNPFANGQLTPRYDILRLTFNGTADSISLSLNNFSNIGRTTFNAYSASDALLQSFTTFANEGWATRTVAVNGVARLDLLNNVFNGSPTYFGIDQLNYTLNAAPAVPEPATWAMLIGGFGLTGGVMRRRARVTFAHA
ncbi:MAG: PEP-CTERM sorting domain-containing protein [Caulobacteraceae bacterium]|nr:MAG: PEP-CTERM sorting domain-containing protein [Caulobacteraceae bacterium]